MTRREARQRVARYVLNMSIENLHRAVFNDDDDYTPADAARLEAEIEGMLSHLADRAGRELDRHGRSD